MSLERATVNNFICRDLPVIKSLCHFAWPKVVCDTPPPSYLMCHRPFAGGAATNTSSFDAGETPGNTRGLPEALTFGGV